MSVNNVHTSVKSTTNNPVATAKSRFADVAKSAKSKAGKGAAKPAGGAKKPVNVMTVAKYANDDAGESPTENAVFNLQKFGFTEATSSTKVPDPNNVKFADLQFSGTGYRDRLVFITTDDGQKLIVSANRLGADRFDQFLTAAKQGVDAGATPGTNQPQPSDGSPADGGGTIPGAQPGDYEPTPLPDVPQVAPGTNADDAPHGNGPGGAPARPIPASPDGGEPTGPSQPSEPSGPTPRPIAPPLGGEPVLDRDTLDAHPGNTWVTTDNLNSRRFLKNLEPYMPQGDRDAMSQLADDISGLRGAVDIRHRLDLNKAGGIHSIDSSFASANRVAGLKDARARLRANSTVIDQIGMRRGDGSLIEVDGQVQIDAGKLKDLDNQMDHSMRAAALALETIDGAKGPVTQQRIAASAVATAFFPLFDGAGAHAPLDGKLNIDDFKAVGLGDSAVLDDKPARTTTMPEAITDSARLFATSGPFNQADVAGYGPVAKPDGLVNRNNLGDLVKNATTNQQDTFDRLLSQATRQTIEEAGGDAGKVTFNADGTLTEAGQKASTADKLQALQKLRSAAQRYKSGLDNYTWDQERNAGNDKPFTQAPEGEPLPGAKPGTWEALPTSYRDAFPKISYQSFSQSMQQQLQKQANEPSQQEFFDALQNRADVLARDQGVIELLGSGLQPNLRDIVHNDPRVANAVDDLRNDVNNGKALHQALDDAGSDNGVSPATLDKGMESYFRKLSFLEQTDFESQPLLAPGQAFGPFAKANPEQAQALTDRYAELLQPDAASTRAGAENISVKDAQQQIQKLRRDYSAALGPDKAAQINQRVLEDGMAHIRDQLDGSANTDSLQQALDTLGIVDRDSFVDFVEQHSPTLYGAGPDQAVQSYDIITNMIDIARRGATLSDAIGRAIENYTDSHPSGARFPDGKDKAFRSGVIQLSEGMAYGLALIGKGGESIDSDKDRAAIASQAMFTGGLLADGVTRVPTYRSAQLTETLGEKTKTIDAITRGLDDEGRSTQYFNDTLVQREQLENKRLTLTRELQSIVSQEAGSPAGGAFSPRLREIRSELNSLEHKLDDADLRASVFADGVGEQGQTLGNNIDKLNDLTNREVNIRAGLPIFGGRSNYAAAMARVGIANDAGGMLGAASAFVGGAASIAAGIDQLRGGDRSGGAMTIAGGSTAIATGGIATAWNTATMVDGLNSIYGATDIVQAQGSKASRAIRSLATAASALKGLSIPLSAATGVIGAVGDIATLVYQIVDMVQYTRDIEGRQDELGQDLRTTAAEFGVPDDRIPDARNLWENNQPANQVQLARR